MSMIRHPAVYTATPLHNRLVLGKHFSYALRDATDPRRMAGLPPLTKTVDVGSVEYASAYADATWYTLEDDTGGAARIVYFVAQEDEDDLYLDQVISLYAMEVGEQIIVAMDLAYDEQGTTSGSLWSFGTVGTNSFLQFLVTTGEVPNIRVQAKGSSASVSTPLTSVGTDLFSAFKAQGRFSCVMSMVPASSTTIDVEMLIGNGTLSGRYTATGVDVRQAGTSGTANPGISGTVTMTNFVGLSVGSQGVIGGPNTTFWGRGAANSAKLDVIHGWRGTYDASLTAAVLAEMHTTNVLDYPPSLAAAP